MENVGIPFNVITLQEVEWGMRDCNVERGNPILRHGQ